MEKTHAHTIESLKREERKTQSKLAEVYTDVRRSYKSSSLFYDYWDKLFVENLNAENDLTILDCGCGVGYLLQKLHKKGHDFLVGLDITPEMLRRARALLGKAVELILADAENLPFRGGSLGAVACYGALHHIPQVRKAILEIARCLRKNGVLLLSETNKSLTLELPRFLLKRSGKFSEVHKALSPPELRAILATNKFNIHRRRHFGYLAMGLLGFPDILPIAPHIPIGVARFLISLDEVLSKIPLLRQLSWHIFIVARLGEAGCWNNERL